jgi:hypothetical protein
MTTKPEPVCWLNSARGVYVPRDFATSFSDRAKHVQGVNDEEWAILEAGPDHEHYWDVWSDVEQGAVVLNNNGVRFTVWNNEGDCWLIPVGMEWDDEKDFWHWPEEDEEP